MTETEKKVQQSTTTYTPNYEPEFKPFSFGSETDSETAFEIEKQYNFDPNSYRELGEKAREMQMPDLEKQQEIVARQEVKNQVIAMPRLNARGKIIVAVYSIIVAIIVAFCIYNAVVISSLNSNIAAKNEIVASQTQVINELEDEYNRLGDEGNIRSEVEGKLKTPTEEDIVYVDDFVLSERPTEQTHTNWFEEFCRKLRKMFS